MSRFHEQDFTGLVPLHAQLTDSLALADIEERIESRIRETLKDVAALCDVVALQDLVRLRRYRQAGHMLAEAVRAMRGEP